MRTCGNYKVDASKTREYHRLCPSQGTGHSHVSGNKQFKMKQNVKATCKSKQIVKCKYYV